MKTTIISLDRQSGVTLVELMIGLALGLLLLFGVGLLFTQNKQSYLQNEQLARLQEEARFALDELSKDLSMAGFIAELSDTWAVQTDPYDAMLGDTVSCRIAGFPGRNWLYDFSENLIHSSLVAGNNLTGGQASTLFSCIDPDGFIEGTDVVGIKRTSGSPSGWGNMPDPVARPDRAAPVNRIYFRESGGVARLMNDAERAADAPIAPFQDWEFVPSVYYVRDNGGVPSLCRVRLDRAGGAPPARFEECIAQGVEDMQLAYGIDRNEDGSANEYVSNPTPQDLSRLVSVRIQLLMRTIDPDVGYRDDRTYSVGDKPDYTPGDRFHRRVYAATVLVRNVGSLRPFD